MQIILLFLDAKKVTEILNNGTNTSNTSCLLSDCTHISGGIPNDSTVCVFVTFLCVHIIPDSAEA